MYGSEKPTQSFLNWITPSIRYLKTHLPRPNFLRLHWTYFILTCLLSSAIFWASSHVQHAISYVDSLFLVTAAMSQAGLNTVNLSSLNTFQQFLLLLLMICGNQLVVSAIVVHVRKRAFKSGFIQAAKDQEKKHAEQASAASLGTVNPLFVWDAAILTRTRPLHRAESKVIQTPEIPC